MDLTAVIWLLHEQVMLIASWTNMLHVLMPMTIPLLSRGCACCYITSRNFFVGFSLLALVRLKCGNMCWYFSIFYVHYWKLYTKAWCRIYAASAISMWMVAIFFCFVSSYPYECCLNVKRTWKGQFLQKFSRVQFCSCLIDHFADQLFHIYFTIFIDIFALSYTLIH